MKYSPKSLEIAEYVQLNADASVESVAKALSLKPHAVRYSIRQMEEHGLLCRSWLINVYPLGLFEYEISFNFKASTKSSAEEFIGYCVAHERVNYFIEVAGDFRFVLGITVREASEVTEFLMSLEGRFPGAIQDRVLFQITSLTEFGTQTYSRRRQTSPVLRFGSTGVRHTIDLLDHKLLRAVVRNPSWTVREIARALGAPSSTVSYRLSRLRSIGVLGGCRFIIQVKGTHLSVYRFLIYTQGLSLKLREKMCSFLQNQESVFYTIEGLGEWDFELGVRAESLDAVRELREKLEAQFPQQIVAITVLAVFRLLKILKYPFDQFPFTE